MEVFPVPSLKKRVVRMGQVLRFACEIRDLTNLGKMGYSTIVACPKRLQLILKSSAEKMVPFGGYQLVLHLDVLAMMFLQVDKVRTGTKKMFGKRWMCVHPRVVDLALNQSKTLETNI